MLSREHSVGTSQRQCWSDYICIWKSFAPSKAQITSWRLVHDRLPTKSNLAKRFLLVQMNFCAADGKIMNQQVISSSHVIEVFMTWTKVIN